jgi:hypothetical protein
MPPADTTLADTTLADTTLADTTLADTTLAAAPTGLSVVADRGPLPGAPHAAQASAANHHNRRVIPYTYGVSE